MPEGPFGMHEIEAFALDHPDQRVRLMLGRLIRDECRLATIVERLAGVRNFAASHRSREVRAAMVDRLESILMEDA